MTRLLYASELKEITEQNMSTKAKELLEFIIKETIEQYLLKELESKVKIDKNSASELRYEILSWEESTTNWVKRHEHIYDVLGINYKGLNEGDPYVVIEYKLKK